MDNKGLKYHWLSNWDKAMIQTIKENNILSSLHALNVHMDTGNKVIVYQKNGLIFIFNFSPGNSIFGYQFKMPEKGIYRILLNSDKKEFGGFERVDDTIDYPTDNDQRISIYLTNRTALVMKKQLQ